MTKKKATYTTKNKIYNTIKKKLNLTNGNKTTNNAPDHILKKKMYSTYIIEK